MSTISVKSSILTPLLTSARFKSAPLKQLAFLCGAKSSGNKDELIARLAALADARQTELPTKRDPLVLSIDLGIRNLGFSLLAPAASTSSSRPAKHSSSPPDFRQPPRVRLHAWQRRELLGSEKSGTAAALHPERFSPASLAIVADRLTRQDILPLKPTHVLIERQRWRSGGAAGVQEWTLRVNTLEAMLHASLRTLLELGHWDGEVLSVAPDRVTQFWPPAPKPSEDSPPKTRRSRSAKSVVEEKAPKKAKAQRSKQHKIGVLTSWLARDESVIIPANQDAEGAVKRFRNLLTRPRRSKGAEQHSEPRKLDDLTDCLVQGMTWLKWEENKAFLLGNEARMYYEDPKNLDKLLASSLLDDGI
ncbi:Ydc2-catalyt-domain-containing protein [Hypoxylon rubiginosum]|uniref:Ydc2-catalyt-domain-containing protein n=1 Tax=Hypoxylon rubiginosum TaxID=110542 RepID=A0ACB9YM50_9PEZI|nr:Ydc2-catalyt-domain-containing protein [Hypoxylon rubiginosum]